MKDVRELVKVKPLEWRPNRHATRYWSNDGHWIDQLDAEQGTWKALVSKDHLLGYYISLDEAQAALQQHHESRIYALLESIMHKRKDALKDLAK